jgi:ferredoxin-NADP reductase
VADGPTDPRWRSATVVSIRTETERAKTFRLALESPSGHLAGQHYVVRLTAPDGYSASRSYSIASAPDSTEEFELTVERLEGGEVSTFLHDEVVIGDKLDVRGPIGGWFVWTGLTPAILVGGGSGIVPLMAILRLARRTRRSDLVRLVVSVRTPGDLYYADEVPGPETAVVYSRAAPAGFSRASGRLMRGDLAPFIRLDATGYVCGSSGFADAASDILVDLGLPVDQIRVERFGPTG